MKITVPAVAALLLGVAAPSAFAQTTPAPAAAPAPAVGATVLDPQGGEVGKIIAVANGTAVIDTGKNKATVELSSIGAGTAGPTIGYTRAQLDAAVENASAQAAAALTAALVPGAEVKAQDGATIGKVAKIADDGNVVIDRPGAKQVALPRDTMTFKDGALSLLFTAAQFEAAIGKATGSAATSASAPTSASAEASAAANVPAG